MLTSSAEAGTAAGVPFVVVPPGSGRRSGAELDPSKGPRPDAPVLVGWHLMDAPRSEAAFAAALPLDGLDAWRVYLGLPMTGARLPAGGMDEVLSRAYEDAVLLVHGPVNAQAADEFDAALEALRERFGLGAGPLGLVGGSAGAGVALEVATRRSDVAALVALSPMVRLRPVVAALGERFGVDYRWSPESDAVAARMDYVTRAGELGKTPVRLVVGSEDDAAFLEHARELVDAATGPADVVVVEGMGHALAEEPGLEPAPQTPHAAEADAAAVGWFRQHLGL